MSDDYIYVKVFPSTGPVFEVGIPKEKICEWKETDDINVFIEEHIKNVETWQIVRRHTVN